mmetsp:Transcript_8473/g.4599  ORF Transcript_8473/g.4599 Transcript_8473/m.4599 type:complete len:174 (-) Transcript_8473:5559-6080(-)
MKLSGKKAIVEQVHEKLKKAKIIILTGYKGFDVVSINVLRRRLREANVEYMVIKNTLLTRASEDTEAVLIKEHFKGSTAIALSFEDPVAPAKVLSKFARENKKFEIKMGVMNGKIIDFDSVKVLSELPSKDVLLSNVLSTMNGVTTAFVRSLNGIMLKVVNVLNAIKEQKKAT